jgi:hypothetical protein
MHPRSSFLHLGRAALKSIFLIERWLDFMIDPLKRRCNNLLGCAPHWPAPTVNFADGCQDESFSRRDYYGALTFMARALQ